MEAMAEEEKDGFQRIVSRNPAVNCCILHAFFNRKNFSMELAVVNKISLICFWFPWPFLEIREMNFSFRSLNALIKAIFKNVHNSQKRGEKFPQMTKYIQRLATPFFFWPKEKLSNFSV